MTTSGLLGSDGSLLDPVTSNEPGATPDSASVAVTVATPTRLWFGGQSAQPGAGMPEMTGGGLVNLHCECFGLLHVSCLIRAKVDQRGEAFGGNHYGGG